MNSKKICFISDAHLGINLPGHEERERLFFNFLRRESSNWSELYIVGDLFDFWVEYRHVLRSNYVEVLHYLWQVIDKGVKIHYLAGNHDFALGPFLRTKMGISVYPGHLSRDIQGKNVYLFHGDGLIKRDFGYRILKKLLRNRVNQFIYKLLHPDIGVPLGSFFSSSSRKYLNKPLSEELRNEYRSCAAKLVADGYDIVIFAHTHLPELIEYPKGIYCNIGSWLKHYSYATMKDGKISLERYHESSPEQLPASESK